MLALSVAGAVPATAKDGDVIRRGSCSGATDWKLKLSPEDGRIEVEYEVDSNLVGQTWAVRIFKNGDRDLPRQPARRSGPSGSFEVRVVTANTAGNDVVPRPCDARRRDLLGGRDVLIARTRSVASDGVPAGPGADAPGPFHVRRRQVPSTSRRNASRRWSQVAPIARIQASASANGRRAQREPMLAAGALTRCEAGEGELREVLRRGLARDAHARRRARWR